MHKIKLNILMLFIAATSFAQVGIGTAAPEADLEIVARTGLTGTEYNGITIPKVTVLPSTVSPSGTILYLDSGTATAGFYFSNGSAFQNVTDILTASGQGAFVETASPTVIANNRSAAITRSGNLSLGSAFNQGKLTIDVLSGNTNGIRNRFNNLLLGTADVNGTFNSTTSSTTGLTTGIRNTVTGTNGNERIGISNSVTAASTANNPAIGIDNAVGAVTGATTIHYGIRNVIGTAASDSNTYGIYSHALGNDTRNNYSGYFRGDRFAIRSEDDLDGYDLPTTSGTAGQVLTANGVNGLATWSALPANNDNDANNEGNLTVVNAGSNQAGIVSDAGPNATQVTLRGQSGSGITITQNIAGGFINIAAEVIASKTTLAANQTLNTSSTWIKLNLNDVVFNAGNAYDNTTNQRFEAPSEGVHRVQAQYHSVNSYGNDNYTGISVWVNGTLVSEHTINHHNNGQIFRSIDTLVELSANDYVEIYGLSNDLNFEIDSFDGKTFFTVQRL